MRVYDRGIYRDATDEELERMKQMEQEAANAPAPSPTPEQRIEALEEELAAAKILLGLEV